MRLIMGQNIVIYNYLSVIFIKLLRIYNLLVVLIFVIILIFVLIFI